MLPKSLFLQSKVYAASSLKVQETPNGLCPITVIGPRIGLVITKEPLSCPHLHRCENIIEFPQFVCAKEDGNLVSELARRSEKNLYSTVKGAPSATNLLCVDCGIFLASPRL